MNPLNGSDGGRDSGDVIMTVAPEPDRVDLVEALVEANDLLVSLVGLTGLPNSDAEWSVQAGAIAQEAHVALRTAGIRVGAPHGSRVEVGRCGAPSDDCYLYLEVLCSGETVSLEAWREGARFSSLDRRFLGAVVNLVASAARISALQQARTSVQGITADHAAAVKIAQTVVPSSRHRSSIDGVQLFGATRPVQTAGGDFYTWIETDHRVFFALGDVSGKGLAAAVLMTTVLNALEHSMRRHPDESPAAIIEALNRWVFKHLSDAAMFVTVTVGAWAPATGDLEVVNAGHSPVLFARDGAIEPIPASVPPIGVLDTLESETWRKHLRSGDALIIGSDGLTEQADWRGHLFGDEAFANAAQRLAQDDDTPAVAAELFRLVDAFAGPAPQSDDRTLMIFRVDELATVEPAQST